MVLKAFQDRGDGVLNLSLAFLNLSRGSRWSVDCSFIPLGRSGGPRDLVTYRDLLLSSLRLGGLLSLGTGVPGLLEVFSLCLDGGVSTIGSGALLMGARGGLGLVSGGMLKETRAKSCCSVRKLRCWMVNRWMNSSGVRGA